MLWYDTILAIADFSHPALKSAKDLLERGERENCARKVIEHFRHRTAPEYLFDADDLRKNGDQQLIAAFQEKGNAAIMRSDEPYHLRIYLSRRNRLAF